MDPTPVHYTEDACLAFITLAASASGNRINSAALAALHDSLDRAEKSEAVRLVLLRANGRVFCHGMDFGFFMQGAAAKPTDDPSKDCAIHGAARDAALRGDAVRAYSGLLTRMRTFPKLIIALVDGEVKAGGVGIVAAADIVIASARSSFQLSEVFLGLLPANVLPFLIERVGAHRAAYLTLSARTLAAAEALACGLADEVFAEDTLEKETRAYLRTLLRADPYALGRGKGFVEELRACGSRKEMTDKAEQTLLDLAARSEVREAITAFEEGGLPSWSAKLKLAENLWIAGD